MCDVKLKYIQKNGVINYLLTEPTLTEEGKFTG